MITFRTVLISFLLFVLASCQRATTDRNLNTGGGQLRVEVIPPPRAVQGKPIYWTFQITNRTRKPVILLELQPSSGDLPVELQEIEGDTLQKGTRVWWIHRVPGSLERNSSRDEFIFSRPSRHLQFPTDRVFYNGLLLPGEKITIRTRSIYLKSGQIDQEFSLRYVHPEKQELRNRMYVSERPLSLNVREKVTFTKRKRLQPAEDRPKTDFFLLDPPFSVQEEKRFSRNLKVYPRPFSMGEALSTLRDHLDSATFQNILFAPWLDSWVILNKNETLWAVSRSRVKQLEDLSFEQILYLSTSSDDVSFFLSGARSNADDLKQIARHTSAAPGKLSDEGKWTVSKRNAASDIAALTRNGFLIEWIREPYSNRYAVLVK